MKANLTSALIDLTRRLLRPLTLESALGVVTGAALDMLPGDHASVRVLDGSGQRLLCGARSGAGANARPMSFNLSKGVLGWVVTHGRPARIGDVATDARFTVIPKQGFSIGSMMAMPIFWDDKILGVLGVTSGQNDAFSEDDEVAAEILANCASPALERARLERLAITDELTMVFNRRYLFARLEEEIERGRRSSKGLNLLFMDLDRFKEINDRYGHAVGDQVLREFVARVRSMTRLSDVMIRRGGDEFVLIMPGVEEDSCLACSERIRKAVESGPVARCGDEDISVSVSIGVARWDGRESARSLEQRADEALYRAKAEGRNTVVRASLVPEDVTGD